MTVPLWRVKNIALFYVLTLFGNSWFITGNWIFFWLRYMTYGQLGWVDALAFLFGMFMEIPTGAVSDLLGKKKTLVLAMALASLGFLIISPAQHRYQILFGFLIAQAGWAFYSGAAEALAYDTLKDKGLEHAFDKVISFSTMLGYVATVAATLIGIALYQWHFRAPHYAVTVVYALGFITALFLKEPKTDSETFSLRHYLSQLTMGARQLMQPVLQKYLPLIFSLIGVYYMFSYGFLKPAVAQHFHFDAAAQGVIFAGQSILAAALTYTIPWMRRHLSDGQGLLVLTALLGIGFSLVGVTQGWWGLIALLLISSAGHLANPWMSVVVNRELSSKYRATTLSTIAMLTKLPYIVSAVLAGSLIERGVLPQFSLVVGGFLLALVVASVGMARRK